MSSFKVRVVTRGFTLVELLIALILSVILVGGLVTFVYNSTAYVQEINRTIERLEIERSISAFLQRELSSAVLFIPKKSTQIKLGNTVYLVPRQMFDDDIAVYVKKADPRSDYFFSLAAFRLDNGNLYLVERPALENQFSPSESQIQLLTGVRSFNLLFYDENADAPIGVWLPEWQYQSLPQLVMVSLIAEVNGSKVQVLRVLRTQTLLLN